MRYIKLLLLVVTVATSGYASERPTRGWCNGAPRVTLAGEAGSTAIAFDVTSIAIDHKGKPWVTTSDGRILTLQAVQVRGGFFMQEGQEWQDVSAMFSNQFNNPRVVQYRFDIQIPPKFKYVTSQPYSGGIWAIDEDDYIYRWNECY